ncbi:MAG: hypothetical protein ABJN34_03595 [Litoreibacter sp.]|uniref:hypothetical protein n=1 Tax=Litoreibacter sp. TaxID=1969459 RepID=UPI0032968EF6
MIEGLKKHHTQTCGPVEVSTYFSPQSSLANFRDTNADPFQYRIVFEIINASGPAGQRVQFQPPTPLAFFFHISLQSSDGKFHDLTEGQIDPHHTGKPTPRDVAFAAKDDVFYSQISYAAFATIAPLDAMREGLYRLSLAPFPIVSIDGKECLYNTPPMDIKVIDGL